MVNAHGSVGAGMEPFGTQTVIPSIPVNTCPAAAHSPQTLILVPAVSCPCHLVARLAFALVSSICVHAHPVLAEIISKRALIYICRGEDLQGLLAEYVELISSPRRTWLAKIVWSKLPALSHRFAAAAVDSRELERHVVAALASGGEGSVARTLSSIQAGPSVLGRDETWLADAVVAGISVYAAPVVAGVLASLAFVLVDALVVLVDHHACWTSALEGTNRVCAVTPVTQALTSFGYFKGV